MLSTLAWNIDGNPVYALEGSIASAGSVLTWLKDKMHIINEYSEIDEVCHEQDPDPQLLVVPAFSGLLSPFWIPDAQCVIKGISLGTDRAQFCTAVIEGICFQTLAVIEEIEKERCVVKNLLVDGGLTKSAFIMQTQACILDRKITISPYSEATVMGAAIAAGMLIDLWNFANLGSINPVECQTFTPRRNFKQKYQKWKNLIETGCKSILNSK